MHSFSRLLYSEMSFSGYAVRSWFRHCATSRKVAGSIPDGVIGIFHWHPSGRTMALGLTQLLTEMSTRNITWGGKGGRCLGLTTLPPSRADCHEIWETQSPGNLWACNGIPLPLPLRLFTFFLTSCQCYFVYLCLFFVQVLFTVSVH
jgi:hypothetical protein